MPTIKPFHFRLAKVSQQQLQIVEGLYAFLPATGAQENFHLAIRKALHKYFADVGYFMERIEPVSFHAFFNRLPSPTCVGVLSLEPFFQKGFVEIDPFLAHLIIEKFLGGEGENMGALRPLTETEQGVIEFLLLKLLAQIHKLCGEAAPLHFRLERMILEASHLRPFGEEKDPLVCLKIHVSLLQRAGFINIYLPHPWVMEGFLKGLPSGKKGRAAIPITDPLARFAHFPCSVWGSLGEATVSWQDLQSLERGDVVLFDRTGLKNKGGHWSGTVRLAVGKGEAGGATARWDGFAAGGEVKVLSVWRQGGEHAEK